MKVWLSMGVALTAIACGRGPASATKDDSLPCSASGPSYANLVVRADGASGSGFADATRAVNGVRGGGEFAGGMDVFSLDQTTDGSVTIRWKDLQVCNGPGLDLVVFENGFSDRRSGVAFFEPIIVSVSQDGEHYVDFPHQFLGGDRPEMVGRRESWSGFAGLHAVLYHEENHNRASHGVNPMDPSVAGGDGFDLDMLPSSELGNKIRTEGFRYLRLTGAAVAGFPRVPMAGQGLPDIDGVYASVFRTDVE